MKWLRLDFSWRVLAAAARLALLYATGVGALYIALIAWTGEWRGAVAAVLNVNADLVAVLAVIGFSLLAIARRIGFVIAWALLIFVWLSGLVRLAVVYLPAVFVFWTIIALPLYLLEVLGFPARPGVRIGRLQVPVPGLVLAGWAALVVLALAVTPRAYFFTTSATDGSFGEPPAWILSSGRIVWGSFPVLVAVDAIARLRPVRPVPSTVSTPAV